MALGHLKVAPTSDGPTSDGPHDRSDAMRMSGVLKTVAVAVTVLCLAGAYVAAQQQTPTATTRPPNILLIISDDIGLDAMSGLYPGLLDDLGRKYGPSALNHRNAGAIQGRAASTPNLDRLARQ